MANYSELSSLVEPRVGGVRRPRRSPGWMSFGSSRNFGADPACGARHEISLCNRVRELLAQYTRRSPVELSEIYAAPLAMIARSS